MSSTVVGLMLVQPPDKNCMPGEQAIPVAPSFPGSMVVGGLSIATRRPAIGASLAGQSHVVASACLGEPSEHESTAATPSAIPQSMLMSDLECFMVHSDGFMEVRF